MKTMALTSVLALCFLPHVTFGGEEIISSQVFRVKNLDKIVHCSGTDPDSRAHGISVLVVRDTETLRANLDDTKDAKFVSNAQNGLFGDAGWSVSCATLPALKETDGVLKQVFTLDASPEYNGKCFVNYRENLYLSVYGQVLYGYDHAEVIPSSKLGCDLTAVKKLIEGSKPGETTVLLSDRFARVTVETSLPDADGMCEKKIVTESLTSKEKTETRIVPRSLSGCGQK